jgi:hypothetical protein
MQITTKTLRSALHTLRAKLDSNAPLKQTMRLSQQLAVTLAWQQAM